MIAAVGIRSLYALALAEGEGVGTAYEYYVKRLALARWLAGQAPRARPSRLLVAGLPEKYGSSLDFALLAAEWGASLAVIDDRAEALARFERGLAAAGGPLAGLSPQLRRVEQLASPPLEGSFDLALCSEVVQRLDAAERRAYVGALRRLANMTLVFVPNGDNNAHTTSSGLAGLTLSELQALFAPRRPAMAGYIDLPPFPPGVTRTDAQRERASSGQLEALAMWGLQVYARLERWTPRAVRRRQAHIIFAVATRDATETTA